jgi:hypothetical protein
VLPNTCLCKTQTSETDNKGMRGVKNLLTLFSKTHFSNTTFTLYGILDGGQVSREKRKDLKKIEKSLKIFSLPSFLA